MPVLKALKKFTYNKIRHRPGDLFKCKEAHLPVFIRGGLATRPEVVISEPVPVYQTRHMEAARTVPELRAEAEAKGIHLPKGYIPKAELQRIIAEG